VSFIFASADSRDEAPAPSTIDGAPGVSGSPVLSADVGTDRLSHDAREAAIKLAGDLVVKYMALANANNGIDYMHFRGLADRARLSMEALIKGRSAAQVAQMESERGLG
jgi:hypothetical protein